MYVSRKALSTDARTWSVYRQKGDRYRELMEGLQAFRMPMVVGHAELVGFIKGTGRFCVMVEKLPDYTD